MASQTFVVRSMENIKTEAEWLADTTYQILPNEQVLAICSKNVTQEDGTQKTVMYIRAKVNTFTSNRLFKELEYSDEYISVQIGEGLETLKHDIETNINGINETITGLNNDINDISGTLSSVQSSVDTNTQGVADNKQAITDLEATVTEQINTKISSAYKASGNVASIDELPIASEANLGKVYNVTAEITTTDSFTEGAGKKVPVGSNIVIVETAPANGDTPATYGYDVVGMFVNLDDYYNKTEVNTRINEINQTLAGVTEDVNGLTTDVSDNSTNISSLTTRVEAVEQAQSEGPDLSGLNTRLDTIESDVESAHQSITGLTTDISGLESEIAGVTATANNAMPKSGGTFTGAVQGITPASSDNSTNLATTAYVKTALAGFSGGANIQISSTQPSGQKANDIWLKIV